MTCGRSVRRPQSARNCFKDRCKTAGLIEFVAAGGENHVGAFKCALLRTFQKHFIGLRLHGGQGFGKEAKLDSMDRLLIAHIWLSAGIIDLGRAQLSARRSLGLKWAG